MAETKRPEPVIGDLIHFQVPMLNTTDPFKCNMWQLMSGVVIDFHKKTNDVLVLSSGEFITIKTGSIHYNGW